jgi:integrase
MKLTDHLARALPGPDAGKSEVVYPDDLLKRFGLRVRRTGARRWIVDYDAPDGRGRRVTLGDPTLVPCAAARRKARELRARTSLGQDPQGERFAARQAPRFGARIADYLAESADRLRPATLALRERHLTLHAWPLHALAASAITRADLIALLATIARERGPVAANRCGATLVGFFGWLMLSGVTGSNPMLGIKPYPEVSRSRVLTDDELARIWAATDGRGDYHRIVRLLLLTASRRSEIGGMRWSEVSGDVFTVPAQRSKNKRSHEVPLHPLALAQMPPRSGTRDAMFGRGNHANAGDSGRSKARLDRRLGDEVARWTLHDLRRTAATWMAERGIEPAHIDAVLNHASGVARFGVRGVYNRASYAVPKRRALTLWAEHVAEITGQSTANVTALGGRGDG